MDTFYDNEEGYLSWVAANPKGYVINCYKSSDVPYRLHRADCYRLACQKNLTTGCTTRFVQTTSMNSGIGRSEISTRNFCHVGTAIP